MKDLGVRLRGLAGSRLRSGIRPVAGPRNLTDHRSPWAVVAAIAALFVVVAGSIGVALVTRSEIAAQARSIHDLQARVSALDAQNARVESQPPAQPDWPAIAAIVKASVVMVSTADSLGSGWVVASDPSGSDVVTNLHVVASAWDDGISIVDIGIGDRSVKGTITRVSVNDDLVLIHISVSLPALHRAALRPQLAQTVMAIGSPLGLDGTVSIGIVSGFRSVEGSDYIQFSAAISPGNSGGPVVDAHGQVVGVATAKFVAPGAEALSLAIPVETVCHVAVCRPAAS
jgi:putative serine protease PepD